MSVKSQNFSNQTTYGTLALPADGESLSFSFAGGLPVGSPSLSVVTDGMVQVSDLTFTLYLLDQDGSVLGQHSVQGDTLPPPAGNTYTMPVDPAWFAATTVLSVTSGAPGGLSGELLSASLDYLGAGVDLSLVSDTGASASDGITSATAPVFSGTAEAGAIVQLKEGADVLGTAVADGAGAWSITASALSEGTHAITATETSDSGGSSATSATFQLLVDATAPVAPSAPVLAAASDTGTVGDGVTAASSPGFTGQAEAGAAVELLEGGSVIGSGTADGSGAWLIQAPGLAEGSHSITARATDAAGNVGAVSNALVFTIDRTAPAAPSAPSLTAASDTGTVGDQVTATSSPGFAGQAEAGATVELVEDGTVIGSGTADGTGAWLIQASGLAEGDHGVTARATDAAGNVGAASGAFVFTIDRTAPSAPLMLGLAAASDSGLVGDGITNAARPVFSGHAEAGSTVRLYNGAALIGTGTASSTNGAFAITATANLAAGVNAITATATDLAGNTSDAASAGVTFDGTAPPLTMALLNDTGASATDRVTRDATLSGTADPNGTVVLSKGGTVLGTATADGAGAWSYVPTLPGGIHGITATSTDAAGNQASASLVFTLDTSTDGDRFATLDGGIFNGGIGTLTAGAYSGPVSYLDWQYINTSPAGTVISANAPNAFIHTGVGDDAIAAFGGSNVLDGDSGSNFLVGASGLDGGADTFFLDGRGGAVTWDTVVNFHQGDAITLWGFTSASSLSWADNQGASGYQGATVHAELGGAGTGITSSLTLAGMSLGDAQAHLQSSTGTTGGVDYLYLRYT